MKAHQVILQPIITEKTHSQSENGTYTFWVTKDATKIDLKNAIKLLYGAEVDKVQISISPEKKRMYKNGLHNKRKSKKKAYISLKKGFRLDLTSFTTNKQKSENKDRKNKKT